jgi:hypothetical protein
LNDFLVASDDEKCKTTAIGDEEKHRPAACREHELLEMNEDFDFDDFQVVRRSSLRIFTSLP